MAEDFYIHFGVRQEDRDTVVPGVAGIPTEVSSMSWVEDWDYPDEDDDTPLHILVPTKDPWGLVPRVLAQYRPLMVPTYGSDDWDQVLLLAVTPKGEWYARNHRGCFSIFAGGL